MQLFTLYCGLQRYTMPCTCSEQLPLQVWDYRWCWKALQAELQVMKTSFASIEVRAQLIIHVQDVWNYRLLYMSWGSNWLLCTKNSRKNFISQSVNHHRCPHHPHHPHHYQELYVKPSRHCSIVSAKVNRLASLMCCFQLAAIQQQEMICIIEHHSHEKMQGCWENEYHEQHGIIFGDVETWWLGHPITHQPNAI